MADALVYYLRPGETKITAPSDDHAPSAVQAIVLSGGGMMPNHGTIAFAKGGKDPLVYKKGNGPESHPPAHHRGRTVRLRLRTQKSTPSFAAIFLMSRRF